MSNVQLTGRERTVVYRDLDSRRILSFGVAGMPPINVPEGIRYETIECLHAKDLERYADEYRVQCMRDNELSTMLQIEKDRAFRKSISDAVRARNNVLDPTNQAINNRILEKREQDYEAMMKRRMSAVPKLAAELYEAGGDETRILRDAQSGGLVQ